LFQYWLVHTCTSFSIAIDYWKFRVPLVASEHRHVFDGLIAVAALHLHRQTDQGTPIGEAHRTKEPPIDNELFLAGNTSQDMLRISTHYLHSAIRGHRTAFENFTDGDFEAVYLSAVLITLISTFLMSASDSLDESTAPFDESMWLRLAVGPRE